MLATPRAGYSRIVVKLMGNVLLSISSRIFAASQDWDPNFVGAGLGVTDLRRQYPNAVDPESTSDAIKVLEQHQVWPRRRLECA